MDMYIKKYILSVKHMINTSLFTLAVIFLLFITTGNSFSQSWSYLGYSKTSADSLFYIFVLNETVGNIGEQKITQKHLFSIPQKLSNGQIYNSILITRTLNCRDKTISTDKAVFSSGVGSTVGTYENKTGLYLIKKINDGRDIDPYLYGKYCSK